MDCKIISSYQNTVACDFAVLCKFYNTFNLIENTHASHKSFSQLATGDIHAVSLYGLD